MNRFRTALAATAAALGIAALTAAPSQAAPQPAFLAPGQMPAAATPWAATPVAAGLPEPGVLCAGNFPAQNTRNRSFYTELDTNGVQVTTVARSEADAAALVSSLRTALAGCAARLQQEYPGLVASSAYHGKLGVEEGAWVYSLDTADPEIGNTDVHLFAVGRDGRTVTYVRWGQMGDLKDAPLTAFRTTAATAVNKLY
ncbi:hypothetical protein ACIQRS_11630 [Streptomyces termitum]|uniref:Uncharacterized protein n=1 Tax=Streptomyces termitum TaxID=67368 RepID=A0A918W6J9_9ACTN|nr:hypothetical protein [Streptomyces termitum]GHA70107.1 hypothetical protein GCM10010305_10480 [Streptomyces termitum]